ncbi:hypothetical protein Bca4012_082931 [Brassica carinata]
MTEPPWLCSMFINNLLLESSFSVETGSDLWDVPSMGDDKKIFLWRKYGHSLAVLVAVKNDGDSEPIVNFVKNFSHPLNYQLGFH